MLQDVIPFTKMLLEELRRYIDFSSQVLIFGGVLLLHAANSVSTL